jgi:hypothetical protein
MVRAETLKIRMTAGQRDELVEEASEKGMSISDLIRERIGLERVAKTAKDPVDTGRRH